MTFFKNTIKTGSVEQLKALEQLGKANANISKFGGAEKTSIFEGSFKNFKGTDLSNVFNDKELKALFTILDADGDGKLNETEVAKMASAGGAKGAGKVDKNDLQALMNDAKNLSGKVDNKLNGNKSVKKLKNGGKIVTVTNPDGSKVVNKYNADGKKTSRVKTDANGDKTTTKYEYINGHLVNSKAKTTRVVNGKKVTVSTEETRYNEKGKREKSVKKDRNGNILSTTDYKYNKNGKLASAEVKNADGSKDTIEYDTATGKRKSVNSVSADGQTKTRVDYDSKTGAKKSKSVEKFDENGKLTGVLDYSYRPDGKYASRVEYDANKKIVGKSTYSYKNDGTTVRTDRDADGKLTGTSEFYHDKNGRKTGSLVKDADGNEIGKTSIKYYASDVVKEETSVKINEDGTETKVVKHYDEDGNLTSIDKTDASGKVTTQKVNVKETKLKDLPKLDRKALEKKYADSTECKTIDSKLAKAIDAKLGKGFCAKVENICKRIKCNPNDLLAMLYSESGLNPKAVNSKSGATGLSQTMPSTARERGTSVQAIYNMSAIDQLDDIEKSIMTWRKYHKFGANEKMSGGQLYAINFLPAYARRDVLTRSGDGTGFYSSNSPLDLDHNGDISIKDLQKRLDAKYKEMYNAFV